MDRPSKTFSKAGFYLILLFSFSISVFPAFAHVIAAAAFILWIVEQIIFRNFDWVKEDMFFPIAGFILFTFLGFLISRPDSFDLILPYTAYLALFYFVVQRFVSLSEKRKMVIWSFITGVVMSSGIKIIDALSSSNFEKSLAAPVSEDISFSMLIALAMALAFYSEGKMAREKLFFVFISIPLVAVAILSFNESLVLIALVLILIAGVMADRSLLLVLAIYLAFIITGVLEFENIFSISGLHQRLSLPVNEAVENYDIIKNVSFYGAHISPAALSAEYAPKSYFLKLLINYGPPALILFGWIIVKQLQMDFVKFHKISFREMKAFHLGAVITIISFILLSFFGTVFESHSIILIFWMVLGMSEI
jgi:hypothetical protein